MLELCYPERNRESIRTRYKADSVCAICRMTVLQGETHYCMGRKLYSKHDFKDIHTNKKLG